MQAPTSDLSYHGPIVAFDLDDTLYPEAEWAFGGYKSVEQLIHKEYPRLSGLQVADMMRNALQRRENPFDAIEAVAARQGIAINIPALLEEYRYHQPDICLFPDAKDILSRLRDKGIRMALITDGRRSTQRQKIKALGIEKFFHPADILISEEVGSGKTSGEAFRRIVHHYPEAKAFYYVGDNPEKDIETPLMMGWTVWLRKHSGFTIHPWRNTAPAPDKILSSLEEIASLI